jgi:hypothetical protein
MSKTQDHSGCAGQLRDGMAALDTEVTVSTEPPLIRGTYTVTPFTCPHGQPYWIEPTGEQIAKWRAENVP